MALAGVKGNGTARLPKDLCPGAGTTLLGRVSSSSEARLDVVCYKHCGTLINRGDVCFMWFTMISEF